MSNSVLEKLAQLQLKNVTTGQAEPFSSLWKDKSCVIIFFRRWGCLFCRLWATELNEMALQLSEKNVRLIGIGADEIGLQDFVSGNYFKGELYVDTSKQAYKDLNFKRFNWFGILTSLFTSESRAAGSKAKELQLSGDLSGDKLQCGGALVVSAGGKEVLLDFKQERPSEHLPNARFLQVLGFLPPGPQAETQPKDFKAECN